MHRILIIDDETDIRETLEFYFVNQGFEVKTAADGSDGLEKVKSFCPEIILLDLIMEPIDGLTVLKFLNKANSEAKVIVMTAYGTVESAVEAMKQGAFDYISKPFRNDDLLMRVRRGLENVRLRRQVTRLESSLFEHLRSIEMVGGSHSLKTIREQINKVMEKDVTVVITGESGTGKELVARSIHTGSKRKNGPFVAVNCATMHPTLVEDELFGHEKGAFTDAKERRIGRFEQADNGTLLLDEICELSLPIQAKLLRIIEERKLTRLGGQDLIPINVRILCATNKDLQVELAEERFREDLYYRLSIFTIHLPPLRERAEDVQILANHFLVKHRVALDSNVTSFDTRVLDTLGKYHWPGNIRELENVVISAMIRAEGKRIKREDLPPRLLIQSEKNADPTHSLSSVVARAEREAIIKAYHEAGGNQTQAARALQISRQKFIRKLIKHSIPR